MAEQSLLSQNRNFRLFFAGYALSAIGTALIPVALSFAVLGMGLQAGALGLVLAAQIVPAVLLLLAGGVVGDRWPRRRLMIGADVLRCVVQIALAGTFITGAASLPIVIALTALIGVGNAFFTPASGGLLPQIVERTQLARANGMLRTANALAMIIGPSLAGLIVLGTGPGWAIAADAVSYAASALCLAYLQVEAAPGAGAPPASRPVLQDLRGGLREFFGRRWLWLMVAQYGLLNMLAIAPFRVIAPALLARLPYGPQAWGLILSAIGAGALAGALAITRWQPRRSLLAIEFAAVALTAPLFLLAVHAPLSVTAAGAVGFGAAAAVLSVLTLTAIQREIPGTVLSRVMSIVQLTDQALTPLGYILAGPAAIWLGSEQALDAGAVCVLVSIVVLLGFADIRDFGAQKPQARKP